MWIRNGWTLDSDDDDDDADDTGVVEERRWRLVDQHSGFAQAIYGLIGYKFTMTSFMVSFGVVKRTVNLEPVDSVKCYIQHSTWYFRGGQRGF